MSAVYDSNNFRLDYAPPVLGNGEVALQLDFMGQMDFDVTELDTQQTSAVITGSEASPENSRARRTHATRFIWWEGRRYMYDMRRFLIPFGRLLMDGDLPARPERWTQTLDTESACMTAKCFYPDGESMAVEAFIAEDKNVLCIRRKFNFTKKHHLRFSYYLTDNKLPEPSIGAPRLTALPRYMTLSPETGTPDKGWRIGYTCIGQHDYEGVLRFFADRELTRSQEGNHFFSLEGDFAGQDEITLYLVLRDNQNEPDWNETAQKQVQDALRAGFDALMNESRENWQKFYAESSVKLENEQLMRVYRAALYDMKCYTTRWSIPVGLNDACWEGKFFAYDEYFSFIGLLTGGHMDLAGRVPRFRSACLPQAISRMSSGTLKQKEARYVWETSETGEEAAIPGFWYEHIFHMCNITVGAWEYFAYTQDKDYLRDTAYPMMRALCEFFLRHMVYRVEGGKTIIGKVTDWERLGSSVENPYMTTCGVIRSLQVTAQAAKLLDIDAEFIPEALCIADELHKGLPDDGEKYIPHPGCTQRSIGVFGGLFPYQIQPENEPLQLAAIADYQKYEKTYGNMYAVGGGVSSWFAAWKSLGYARLHRANDAQKCLDQAAETCGVFGELFEINEPKVIYRPWFTTANGIYLAAVHQALVQSRCRDDAVKIDLLPGWTPESGNAAFTLPAEGDIQVRLTLKGTSADAVIIRGKNCTAARLILHWPDWVKTKYVNVEGFSCVQEAKKA